MWQQQQKETPLKQKNPAAEQVEMNNMAKRM